MKRAPVLVALSLVTALAATGCSGDDGPSIVVYNAQHEQLLEEIAPKFTEKTGIEVELRNGSDPELAAQLIQEGDASPADVFLTENSPAMSAVERAGLFAPLDAAAVEPIPAQYRPDERRCGPASWPARPCSSTTPSLVDEAELPDSILDLADPEWAGQISFSPTGADFQAIVAAVLDLEGEEATQEWLDGIKANGTVYDGNNVVLESVNAGESAIGIIYHYYWYRDQAEAGENSDNTELYFFGNQDPGAFLSHLRRGRARGRATTRRRPSSSSSTSPARRASRRWPTATRWSTRSTPPSASSRPVKPLAELQPPTVGDLRPRRRDGRRADDRGRLPLTASPTRPVRAGTRDAVRRWSSRCWRAGRRDQPAPAGLRRRLLRPARAGGGRRLPGPAARRRAAVEHHPAARRRRGAERRRSASACAWLVVRTDLPGRPPVARRAVPHPLAVPAFVNGYGWVSTTHAVQSYAGAVLVVSLSYYPLVYLPTVAALRRLDSRLEDVAAALGHRPLATFLRVVLPAISPAVLGGALLVGLHLLGRVRRAAAPQLPDADDRDPRRSTAPRFNGPAATLLALVLVAFCLLLLGLELLARGRRRHSRVGAGVSRTADAARASAG